jgi:hypothetical protein
MDEKLELLIAEVNQPITPRSIPADAHFYRHVFLKMVSQKKYLPTPSCFAYTPQGLDDGLSVDWATLTTPELSLGILGRTFKHKSTELKEPQDYALYRIDQSFLVTMEDVPVGRHDPVYRKNPPLRGEPNNPAHTVLRYANPNDEEIRVKLQNHVQRVTIDQGLVAEVVARLAGMEE